MKKIIIIMPVANEEKTMKSTIDGIMGLGYDNLYLYPIIDAYSKDRTEQIIRDAEKKYNGKVKCVFYKKSTGVVSCYKYGYRCALKAGADYILEMDGGESHDYRTIPKFIKAIEQGYDCVYGSRFMKGGKEQEVKLYRRILSSGGTWLSNLVLGTKLTDMTSGYEAYSADVIKQLDFSKFLSTGHFFQTELKYYCRKYKYKEIPIVYTGGNSSLKFKFVLESIRLLFIIKRNEKRVRHKYNSGSQRSVES